MSEIYKTDPSKGHFITLTVIDWLDVFTRLNHKIQIIDSLRFCQQKKGLEIYGYCLMTNHLHMIAGTCGRQTLPEIIRDFKQFTAKAIIRQIVEEPESRRDWMIDRFQFRAKYLNRNTYYKFWEDGYHPVPLLTPAYFYKKLNYIHNNPVKELIVEKPEEYYFSSARNYAGLSSPLEVILETPQMIRHPWIR